MLKLLLDENISPHLSGPLWERGVDTIALRDRGLLQVGDHTVWSLGQKEGRSVVTINSGDFRRLARQTDRHAGLVIIPSGRTRDGQLDLIVSVIDAAREESAIIPSLRSRIVEVDEEGQIHVERNSQGETVSFPNLHIAKGRPA